MNREIYEKNMEALKNKFPMWAEKLASVKRKKRNFDVLAENSYFGNTILKVNDNGKILYLMENTRQMRWAQTGLKKMN